MPTKTKKTKSEIKEREYVIPLRVEWRKVPRYKRAAKAVKAIKEFLVKHMRIYDRDLKKIKIDNYLNEFVWFRGIKRPPHKVKVKARMDGENVIVELAELPTKLKFKKAREDKREEKGKAGKKKKVAEKPEEKTEESDEKKEESGRSKTSTSSAEASSNERKKTKSGEEEMKKLEKSKSKEIKHSAGGKQKQKTQPVRKALKK